MEETQKFISIPKYLSVDKDQLSQVPHSGCHLQGKDVNEGSWWTGASVGYLIRWLDYNLNVGNDQFYVWSSLYNTDVGESLSDAGGLVSKLS